MAESEFKKIDKNVRGGATRQVQSAVTEAVAGDEVLRKHARNVAIMAMAEAVDVMRNGTPAAKAAMVSKFVPAIMKGMDSGDEDDEITQMRAEYKQMFKEMGGEKLFGADDE